MENRSEAIIQEVKKVIVGKDAVLRKVLMAILAGGHVLLEDIPGVGKTTMALAFSRALDLACNRIQCTPDLTPSDIVGFSIYQKRTDTLEYKPGAVMCNLLLADEINRSSSKTQSALLEVMEEGNATVDGVTRPLPRPFVVLATQNPVGSAGTQLLPQSQLDRFMVCLEMGYPDFESHVGLLRDRQNAQPLESVQQVADADAVMALRARVGEVHVKDDILAYITRLCEATRDGEDITLGVSPRGALALLRMAKAGAWLAGRDYVIPDDVQAVFTDVCAHRLVLSPKAKIAGTTGEAVLRAVLAAVAVPAIAV